MRELYEQHYEAIYQYILYLITDADLAADFVQETFIRFYKMKDVNEPKAALFRITRNLVYDYFRRKRLIKWLLMFMVVALVAQVLLEKRIHPKDETGHKEPNHSHPSQTVVDIVLVTIVVGAFLWGPHINIWWLVGCIIVSVIIKIMIETHMENANWRKMLFIMNVMYMIVWLFFLADAI